MILSRRQKIAVGVATAWTVLYPFLFFAAVLLLTLGISVIPVEEQGAFPGVLFAGIFPLHCLTILITLGLMAFYLAHVIKNTEASDTVRIILGVGVFMVPFVVMPITYYFFVWRDDVPKWARPS